MVKIIGYYVVFKGHPESRRAPIRLSVANGIEAMRQWYAKQPLLIKGSGYANSSIDSIEKITTYSEIDIQRALKQGYSAVTEDELKQLISKSMSPDNVTLLPGGNEPAKLTF